MKHVSVLLSLVLFCAIPSCSGSLSKSIEFDRLLMHARNAVSAGDYRTAADNFAHAMKLDVGPPESFYLDYAGTLGALGRWKDARTVLQSYFEHFDKQGAYYDLALRRYVDAEDKVSKHSAERVRPELIGTGKPTARAPVAPAATQWAKAETPKAPSALPPMQTTQMTAPANPDKGPLERLIGLYSGETKDSDTSSQSSICEKTFSGNKPHPASDCFYGYHRNMSLNAIDGQAVVGFVKVDYVREHRPASSGEMRDRKLTTYTKMEYYLGIRLWITPGGLIQGQQKPLCEFMVEEKMCTLAAAKGVTPLRAKITPDGGLGLESEKGGGPRIYTKVRAMPDVVRSDVVRAVPSLGAFVTAPAPRPDRPSAAPAETQERPSTLGDTARMGDEMDDSIAARFSASAR